MTWEQLDRLSRELGDSFQILAPAIFRQDYQELLDAFRCVYPKSRIAYSYKTNYTPKLCRAVDEMGGYAEVVSGMEYNLARRLGVDPERIIFNGPYKSNAALERALEEGAVVNLDSFHEIDLVEGMARDRRGKAFRLGLRCNFPLEGVSTSRFGFDAKNGLPRAIERLRQLDNCKIVGLHCHFLPSRRTAEIYAEIARRMLEIARNLLEDGTEFVDIGGGFYSKMTPELERQFGRIPSFSDYGTAIASEFRKVYGDGPGPELIIEPGVAVTANCMRYVTRVVDVKTVGPRTVALVAGTIYDIKPTLSSKNLPMSVVKQNGAASRSSAPLDVVGYTCMEHDCLYKDFEGPIAAGDFVVFNNVGAYTNVLRPPFINPAPAIVIVDGGTGETEVVRRPESAEDVFATYVF